ncbi:diacylglycerol kinase family protein [Lentibacillus halodurans]|uniref:diacylglycerol kinase family protein n=1 Tax=Lentibacillus halodurans TaxID=237679 RepID=UPI000B801352|nr:diacylglycerol kinase family protein [Lentibacillus halodurans]
MNDKQGKSVFGFIHAWNGLKAITRTERNFRIHIMAAVFAVAAGLAFRLSVIKWSVIILVIGLVLIAEILNTAIEKMLDYLKPDLHPQAKFIKDLAAGSVLVSAVIAVLAGMLVFIPELYKLFR